MTSWNSTRAGAALRGAVTCLACCALGLAPAAAQDGTVAKMEVGERAVVWHPAIEYDRLVLAVSGAGADLRREFASGSRPKLEIGDPAKGGLADGTYSYELLVVRSVSAEMREKMAAAREALDQGREVDLSEIQPAVRGPSAQSGSFTIREGVFVRPGGAEPGQPGRPTGDVRMEGSLEVAGAKKFVAADPADAGGALVYAALEGPEAGTYHRGTARTLGGEAVIELPRHFGAVTEAEGLTVQLTPVGRWSRLYVVEKSPRRLVVRSADDGEVEFDYLVQGVREGYAGFQVERSADPATPDTASEER